MQSFCKHKPFISNFRLPNAYVYHTFVDPSPSWRWCMHDYVVKSRLWQLCGNLILCNVNPLCFCGTATSQRRWEMRFSVDNTDTYEMVFISTEFHDTFTSTAHTHLTGNNACFKNSFHFSMQQALVCNVLFFFLVDNTQSGERKKPFVSDAYDTNFRAYNKYNDYTIDRA